MPTCPSLWTHEPHIASDVPPGRQGRRHRHQRDARVSRAPRPTRRRCRPSATSGSPSCRRCCTPTAGRGDTRSVLLVLQGMDTAGKGGIVKHVVGAGESAGHPVHELRQADRGGAARTTTCGASAAALPTAGHIGVFDRSHYEDVLIVRVHNLVPPEVWGARYDEINEFEKRARRRRHDDRQGRDVRLARRAEEAAGRTPRAARQVLEVQPGRHRRARCCGRSTRRPTRRCSTARRPTTRRGTSCRATASGTAGWPITELLIEALEGSTCLGRQPISTSRPRRSGSQAPNAPRLRFLTDFGRGFLRRLQQLAPLGCCGRAARPR